MMVATSRRMGPFSKARTRQQEQAVRRFEQLTSLLQTAPADPELALNYEQLFSLWKEACEQDLINADAGTFDRWDKQVRFLLSGVELEYYLGQLLNFAQRSFDQAPRITRLTEILLLRQGYDLDNL
jgi:hypothetical protein